MRTAIFSVISMLVAAMPAVNAQQQSPSVNTVKQQTSKPKVTGTRALPQPMVQPTQATKANNNSFREKKAGSNPGNGKTSDNNHGPGKPASANGSNYTDAMRRYRHERHDHDWWKQHYTVIVLVGGGYYYWDSGYWYPALGYDPNYERYDYDGPIFTYGNLLPDQVIVNVQSALQQLGYYTGDLNGSLGVDTRQAITAYQRDYGLDTTGVVDEATVRALGLI
jgi:murein L,D-transpeptidase YcbB/YkuD